MGDEPTETERMMPTSKYEPIKAEPPEERKGKGLPVVGARPITQQMFKKAWKTSMVVHAPAIIAPNWSDA